ncbi:hypothetical protein BJH93_00955 [Kocuria polaris]|nr:hypothetical protein [Kocuria polaris]
MLFLFAILSVCLIVLLSIFQGDNDLGVASNIFFLIVIYIVPVAIIGSMFGYSDPVLAAYILAMSASIIVACVGQPIRMVNYLSAASEKPMLNREQMDGTPEYLEMRSILKENRKYFFVTFLVLPILWILIGVLIQ